MRKLVCQRSPKKGSEKYEDYIEKYHKILLDIPPGCETVLYDGMVIQNRGAYLMSVGVFTPKDKADPMIRPVSGEG